jgi:hypothetical protein
MSITNPADVRSILSFDFEPEIHHQLVEVCGDSVIDEANLHNHHWEAKFLSLRI